MTWSKRSTAWRWSLWAARIVTAVGLAIDAYVHWDLAPVYAEVRGTIDEGALFRAEAVVALLTAVAVIATGRRAAYLAGLAVGASALTALLIARYVDLGQLGPFPDLYDPTWFPEKLLAAFAEGAATAAALAGAIFTGRALGASRPRRRLPRRGLPQRGLPQRGLPQRGLKVTAGQSEQKEYRDQEEHRNDTRISPRRPAP